VVWWAKRTADKTPATALTYCTREGDRAKLGAEALARELAGLSTIGSLTPEASPDKDCLWDIQLTVKDDAVLPASK
jgi:hypothetical protein